MFPDTHLEDLKDFYISKIFWIFKILQFLNIYKIAAVPKAEFAFIDNGNSGGLTISR